MPAMYSNGDFGTAQTGHADHPVAQFRRMTPAEYAKRSVKLRQRQPSDRSLRSPLAWTDRRRRPRPSPGPPPVPARSRRRISPTSARGAASVRSTGHRLHRAVGRHPDLNRTPRAAAANAASAALTCSRCSHPHDRSVARLLHRVQNGLQWVLGRVPRDTLVDRLLNDRRGHRRRGRARISAISGSSGLPGPVTSTRATARAAALSIPSVTFVARLTIAPSPRPGYSSVVGLADGSSRRRA